MRTQPPARTSDSRRDRPYVRIVREIQGSSLTQDEIARIVRADARTVQNWAAGATKPQSAARDRLLELNYLCVRLRSFLAEDAMEIFWHSRNQWLDDERPIAVLERGEFDLVLRIISSMGNIEY